jgi:hypothetical protein
MAPKQQKTTAYVTPQGLYVPNPKTVIAKRAPATTDVGYEFGTLWVDKIAGASYQMVMISAGAATWITLGGGSGAVATLTGNSGGAISPVAGNINIVGGAGVTVTGAGSTLTIALTGGGTAIDSFVPDAGTNPVVPSATGSVTMAGTANQITTTGGLNSLTFSVPAIFIAPGSIAATTTATAVSFITSSATVGTTYTNNSITPTGSDANISLLVNGKGTGGVVHSRGLVGGDVTFEATNTDNTNAASNAGFEAAVGGTSAGDPYFQSLISGGQVFSWGIDNSTANDDWVLSKSATLGTSNQIVIDGSTGAFSTVAGITAATTLTATLGNITATNGNFVASAAGTGLVLPVGTASGATPQIVDARVGSVTFTGISIAAAADLTLTLTNSTITGAATRVMLSMIGATTGSALSIKSVTPSAGSLAIVVTNGTGATTTTADITFDFMVLN